MLLQDKELVNTQLIKIDTNVKEKYLLLQNKGYVNGYIFGFRRVNSQKTVLLLPFLIPLSFAKKQIRIKDTKHPVPTQQSNQNYYRIFSKSSKPHPQRPSLHTAHINRLSVTFNPGAGRNAYSSIFQTNHPACFLFFRWIKAKK
jgi:hypothetical protein